MKSLSLKNAISGFNDQHLNIYLLEHGCTVPGSKKVLVADGNVKNSRQVAHLHFGGMPGSLVVS